MDVAQSVRLPNKTKRSWVQTSTFHHGIMSITTIKILKVKIRNVAPDTTQRQTRNTTHNHGEVGLQLDEDNALVASEDEDETSKSISSSSNGS